VKRTTKITSEGTEAKLTSRYFIITQITQEIKPDVMKNNKQQLQQHQTS
jgi:hypothetical protein